MPTVPSRTERRILGGALMRIRTGRNISQVDLARRAGLQPANLCHIERGDRNLTNLAKIVQLAAALEVDVDDISYVTAVYVIAGEDTEAAA